MSSQVLRAYLVEDEPLCRADFREVLRAFPDIQLLGEAETITQARNFLERHPVDLIFLDLSVGKENGLDLVEQLTHPPLVIALTAHPQHAVRGFTLNLVDYVLKPVEEERLRVAVDKAHQRHASEASVPGKVTLGAEINRRQTTLELAEILGVEAMGNYVVLHTLRGKALKRATFGQVSKKLPSALFLLTGRGRMVARKQIREWGRDAKRQLVLQTAQGESILVARSQSARVLRQLKVKDLP
jgi:two-component system LytT family response regulator